MMNCQNVSKGEKPSVANDLALTLGADKALTRQRRGRDPIEGLAKAGKLTAQQVAVADCLMQAGGAGGSSNGTVSSWAPYIDRSLGAGGIGVKFSATDIDFSQWVKRWERRMSVLDWPVSAIVQVIRHRRPIRDTETAHNMKNGSLTPMIGPAIDLYVAL